MKVFIAVLGISSLFFFASCQPELSETDNLPDTVIARIKSVVYIDSTKASGMDTMYKSVFTYDGSNRLLKGTHAEYEYIGSSVNKYEFTYDFFYNGTSTNPYKIAHGQTSFLGSNAFLTFNSSNEIIRDSSVQPINPTTYVLSVFKTLSNGAYQMVLKQNDAGMVTDRDSIIYRRTILNGNIVAGIDSNHHASLGLERKLYAYTYDNKPNPFTSLERYYSYLGQFAFTADGVVLPLGKNNALTYTETFEDAISTDTFAGTVSYTYRSDGLPVIGRFNGTGGYPNGNKIFFEYY